MEVLGVAASAAGLASIAVQLGDSVSKIRHLYRGMRNAPAKLEDVLLELTTVELHLRQLVGYRASTPKWGTGDDAFVFDLVVKRCTDSVQKIANIADKLDARMARSKLLGRISLPFHEAEVEHLWQTIEREKSSLALLCQLQAFAAIQSKQEEQQRSVVALTHEVTVHGQALTNVEHLLSSAGRSPNLAVACPQPSTQTIAASPPTQRPLPLVDKAQGFAAQGTVIGPISKQIPHVSSTIRETAPQCKKRGHSKVRRSYKLSPWFMNTVWQLTYAQVQGSRTMTLHTWNVVPSESAIFVMCDRGSISGVRKLISAGKASFRDIDERGRSLFDRAAFHTGFHDDVGLQHYLLANCEQLGQRETLNETLRLIDRYSSYSSVETKSSCTWLPLLQRFDIDIESYMADLVTSGLGFHGFSATTFEHAFRPTAYFANMSTQATFSLALHLYVCSTPADLLRACNLDRVTTELATFRRPCDGATALHFVAKAMCTSRDPKLTVDMWQSFAQELVSHGADLHAMLADDRYTPFRWLVRAAPKYRDSHNAVTCWAALMHSAGVNLAEYGRVEHSLWRQTGGEWEERADFNYGPTPGEWRVHEYSVGWKIDVYERLLPPGAFPPVLPTTITWEPTYREEVEGPWRFVRLQTLQRRERCVAQDLEPWWEDEGELRRAVAPSYDDGRMPLYPSRTSRWVRENIRRRSVSSPSPFHERLPMDEFVRWGHSLHICQSHKGRFMCEHRFLSVDELYSDRACVYGHGDMNHDNLAWELKMEHLAS